MLCCISCKRFVLYILEDVIYTIMGISCKMSVIWNTMQESAPAPRHTTHYALVM